MQLSPAQRAGALVFGALQLLLVVGLFMQLLVLQDSNDRIHAQDAKIAALREDTRPFLREAAKLTGPLSQTADDVSVALEDAPLLVDRSLPLIALLRQAIPRLTSFVPELRGLFPRARRAADAALVLERLQREALTIQKQQFGVQQETLAVQLEALEHIENIDRKTGGDLQP